MSAVVLESFAGSEYEDTPSGYEFPERYLSVFENADYPVVAVLYEPRGDNNQGRIAYVAMALISRPPTATQRRSTNGQRLWRVEYQGPAVEFDRPVPREPMGEPAETWLRARPRGRERNVATFGRAVRPLADEDLARILELGNARVLADFYPSADEHATADVLVAERPRRLVDAIQRDSHFRATVLAAYEYRCAISGLGIGSVAPTKSRGLIDAAHIRPVASMGPDAVENGIPMTPTVHRYFDAGLFTLVYEGDQVRIKTSSLLTDSLILVKDRATSLPLREGLPIYLPRDGRNWPNPDHLRFHQHSVFRSS